MADFLDIPRNVWDHVEELRRVVLRILFVIFVGTAVAFWFYPLVYELLTSPLNSQEDKFLHQEIKQERVTNSDSKELMYEVPKNARVVFISAGTQVKPAGLLIPPGEFISIENVVTTQNLVLFSPIEGVLSAFKTCFWVGLVGTSPVWLLFLLNFVAPALHPHERRLLMPFLLLSLLFLSAGIAFAYFVTIPLANQYFITFNEGIGVNLWSLANYLDYTVVLLLSSGLAFEIAVMGLFLVHFGMLSPEKMRGKRQYAVVGAFIIGALLTPPDIFSQLMLAIPLILLYEFLIVYAGLVRGASVDENGPHELLMNTIH